ncbi:twin-arginine translocase TatA/TatE family subunit [Sporosarcina cascadiensis]|uniref:twin-arginine translocase TatA/TatE family subunit n=1 Tax=Sporosarcina cascadiensis TaxID=2660747 RepID=UPI00129ACE69|nr:twin-arginine translocase TatA/TatE family subunit [Sporosarcina cascadiensis]
MNLAAIGVPGLIIILVIILILFGPRKLPEVGSAVGKTLAEFKKSAKDIMDDDDTQPPAKKLSDTEKTDSK